VAAALPMEEQHHTAVRHQLGAALPVLDRIGSALARIPQPGRAHHLPFPTVRLEVHGEEPTLRRPAHDTATTPSTPPPHQLLPLRQHQLHSLRLRLVLLMAVLALADRHRTTPDQPRGRTMRLLLASMLGHRHLLLLGMASRGIGIVGECTAMPRRLLLPRRHRVLGLQRLLGRTGMMVQGMTDITMGRLGEVQGMKIW
jgi:hypothetical protein